MTGMVIPALTHKFRFILDTHVEEINRNFMQTVVSIEIDFVNRTVTGLFRENVLAFAMCGLKYSKQWQSGFIIEMIDGNDKTFGKLLFANPELIEHTVKFDYANVEPLLHNTKWKFDNYTVEK